jgi:hypothetical protein
VATRFLTTLPVIAFRFTRTETIPDPAEKC